MASAPGSALGAVAPVHAVFTPIKIRAAPVSDRVERAEIVKRFTFFFEKYEIEGLDWTIEGDFWAHEYRITQNGREIVSISKEWFTWGDCYALDIADSADEMLALAVVLAIDAVHAQANAAAAST